MLRSPVTRRWGLGGVLVGLGAATASVVGVALGEVTTEVTVPALVAVLGGPVLLGGLSGLGIGFVVALHAAADRAIDHRALRAARGQPAVPPSERRAPHVERLEREHAEGDVEPEPRPLAKGGGGLAVLGVLGMVLAGPLLPILPLPMLLSLGALALDERTWARVVADAGVVIGTAVLVGLPLAAVTVSWTGNLLLGFAGGAVAGGVAGWQAISRLRPTVHASQSASGA